MENDKLKYILLKQKLATTRPAQQAKEFFLKMKYEDFGLAYGMKIDYEFDDMFFLAKRIEEYREGQRVKTIILEKDVIKIWLKRYD